MYMYVLVNYYMYMYMYVLSVINHLPPSLLSPLPLSPFSSLSPLSLPPLSLSPLSPLYREGHLTVAQLLLNHNARVNIPSGSENNIPLTLACWKGQSVIRVHILSNL